MMTNRLTRAGAAQYLGCSLSTFDKISRLGYLDGTYYTLMGKKFYIIKKLEAWLEKGGCEAFKERG